MSMNISRMIDLTELDGHPMLKTVAYFVDNQQFLDEVDKTRELVGIKSPLKYEDAKKWLKVTRKEKEGINYRIRLSISVSLIKEKFKKGVNYTNIIKYSILAKKVTPNEIERSAFCEIYPFPEEFENAEFFAEEPMVAIFVNPETKDTEVKKLMKTKVKDLFKKHKRDIGKTNITSEFNEVRNVYWGHVGKKSNKELSLEYGIEESGISKILNTYKSKIRDHSSQ